MPATVRILTVFEPIKIIVVVVVTEHLDAGGMLGAIVVLAIHIPVAIVVFFVDAIFDGRWVVRISLVIANVEPFICIWYRRILDIVTHIGKDLRIRSGEIETFVPCGDAGQPLLLGLFCGHAWWAFRWQ
jgi:hypothetical protein